MISYAYENLFKLDSQKKDLVITDGTVTNSGTSVVITGDTFRFTNSDIHYEEFSLLESLCTESVLHFGACESSELQFTISSQVVSLEGKTLHVWLYFNDDANTLFKVGTYKVKSDVATAKKTVRQITAYDLMLDVLNTDYTDWYNGLSDTVNTVKKFRDAFFTHVGITQKTVTLVNDNSPVKINEATGLTGAIILRAICEINGRFGHMTRDNLFDYVKLEQNIQGLYPAVDLYPSPSLYPRQPKSVPIGSSGNYVPPLKYESYEVPSITRLQIRRDSADIGVVVGTAGTDYIVQGNLLTVGLNGTEMTTAATNLLGEISGVVFQPFSFSMRTNLCLEVGDAIRCNDETVGVEGYMLYRSVKGIQAMFDDIRCDSKKDYSQNVNSVSYQLTALSGKTLVLKQDIDGVSTELTEQLALDGIVRQGTYAEQTNTKFSQKVSVEYGNHTTDSFSWDMDITGHTWYKSSQQVMKIDGSGLTVTGTIKGSKFYCGTEGYETTLIDSEGKTARFANNTINFSDQTVEGVRIISSDIAKGTFHINYRPDDSDADISIGNSNTELSAFDIYNPVDLSIRRVETGKKLTVLELLEYDVSGHTRIMLGARDDGSEMPTQTYIGGKTVNIVSQDGFSNIVFQTYVGGSLGQKTLASIISDISSCIEWGSASGIENTGSGLALNPPNYSGYVHIGYQANAITIGSGSLSSVRIMGKDCSFHQLHIGNTTYYLLGYTA